MTPFLVTSFPQHCDFPPGASWHPLPPHTPQAAGQHTVPAVLRIPVVQYDMGSGAGVSTGSGSVSVSVSGSGSGDVVVSASGEHVPQVTGQPTSAGTPEVLTTVDLHRNEVFPATHWHVRTLLFCSYHVLESTHSPVGAGSVGASVAGASVSSAGSGHVPHETGQASEEDTPSELTTFGLHLVVTLSETQAHVRWAFTECVQVEESVHTGPDVVS